MERSICNLDRTLLHQFRSSQGSDDHFIVGFVHTFRNRREDSTLSCILLIQRLHVFVLDGHYALCDSNIMGRSDLTAICPVHLVTIVLGRVMGGCNDNACCGSKCPDTVGKHWYRMESIIEICPDSVG